jgi:tetratricopeptide (TPR) repeat protein
MALGWLYEKMGKAKAAEEALESSVVLGEKCLKEEPRLAELLVSLGQLYTDRGRYKDAEPLFKHALLLTESSAASVQRVAVLRAYRDFLHRAGRLDEAAGVEREVVAIEGNAPFQGVPALLPPPPALSSDNRS